MKKFLSFFILASLLTSCQKDPDTSDLDSDFVVFTNYDNNADFSSYTTYFIPDSVLIIGKEKEPRYWSNQEAADIIPVIVNHINERGYTQVTDKAQADMGIQVSFVNDVSYFYTYNDYPYWWWGYPGYWSPGYWGGWGGWYYPYPIHYTYNVGSLIVEIVDLKAKAPKATDSLPLVWTAYMTGLLSGSDKINAQLSIRALNQAFAQSGYLKKHTGI